ncbi:hypothetical protein LRK_14630 [Lacticaseibacillus rhamnosus K32]|nr:hypothetical protein LRK_14630 [Lacticaseibacillus rhamnosus K32]OAU22657.1 hypothetical protein PY91_12595 [Lacticaseibacillus rhamnosus]
MKVAERWDVDQKIEQTWRDVFATMLVYTRMIRVYSCKQKTRYFFISAKNSASFVVFGFG